MAAHESPGPKSTLERQDFRQYYATNLYCSRYASLGVSIGDFITWEKKKSHVT